MLTVCCVVVACVAAARAQTTAFTYQGRLNDSATPANGSYDLQFTLFDDGGTQIGTTQTLEDVTVANGVFTVQLDFGAAAFTGANRVLKSPSGAARKRARSLS